MGTSQKGKLLEELSEVFLSPNSSEAQRASAKRALQRLADQATLTTLARRALTSDIPEVPLGIFELLASKPHLRDLEPLLIGFFYDSSPEVRRGALRLIEERGSSQMLPALDEVIAAARDPHSILGAEELAAAERARRAILDRQH